MKKISDLYPKLVKDLRLILQTGQVEALKQLDKIRAETYWHMGKRLFQIPQVKKEQRIPSAWSVSLQKDLGLDRTRLSRILKFYQEYPKGLPKVKGSHSLSWSAHVLLFPLQEQQERNFYLQKASEQGWSVQQLKDALKQNLYAASQLPPGKSKSDKGRSPKKLKRPDTGLYLYTAIVERVIDGDTLLVRIDLGFDVWKTQRLRLRAIDCPELKTPQGQAAKAFVQEILQPNDFVILKTYKMDLYGRFVCDVFFSPGEKDKQKVFTKGTFLNQLLLDEKHAVVV